MLKKQPKAMPVHDMPALEGRGNQVIMEELRNSLIQFLFFGHHDLEKDFIQTIAKTLALNSAEKILHINPTMSETVIIKQLNLRMNYNWY